MKDVVTGMFVSTPGYNIQRTNDILYMKDVVTGMFVSTPGYNIQLTLYCFRQAGRGIVTAVGGSIYLTSFERLLTERARASCYQKILLVNM